MLKREMNIADYDAELWQAMEQEKLHQPARNAGAGFSADQQIC